jgi:RES domain-containing protein
MPLEAYRLVRTDRAEGAFSGEGSRLFGGRWNPKGVAVVYCSQHLSLCVLEFRVNQDRFRPQDGYVFFRVLIPEQLVERLPLEHAPRGWDRRGLPSERPTPAQRFGERWVQEARSAVLEVPSAVLPPERNYVLNPQHRDFGQLHVERAIPIRLDERLWR